MGFAVGDTRGATLFCLKVAISIELRAGFVGAGGRPKACPYKAVDATVGATCGRPHPSRIFCLYYWLVRAERAVEDRPYFAKSLKIGAR